MRRIFRIASIAVLTALSVYAASADDLFNVPQGTIVPFKLTQEISTRTTQPGATVPITVADDVYVGTKLVIPAGKAATATVVKLDRPGNWGKSGRLELTFSPVEAIDKTSVGLIPVSKKNAESQSYAIGAAAGGAMILGPVGLIGGMFVRGNHIDIPAGSVVAAEVRFDTVVSLGNEKKAAPLPVAEIAPVEPVVQPEPAPVVKDVPVETAPVVVAQPVVAPAPAKVQPPAPAVKAETEKPVVKNPVKPETKPASKPEVKPAPVKIPPVIPIIEDVEDQPSRN